uniref:Kinesin motor domain-containing protein n=1 Tax=Chromera velia CCMP2878 TaxID=1169474 RepID=A0A0G4HM17_9ALVE
MSSSVPPSTGAPPDGTANPVWSAQANSAGLQEIKPAAGAPKLAQAPIITNVNVFVRLRPTEYEPYHPDVPVQQHRDDLKCVLCKAPQNFSVDQRPVVDRFDFTDVVPTHEANRGMYERLDFEQVVHNVMGGYQETIFAYGQTGSGKTHTILGNPGKGEPGLLDLLGEGLFSKSAQTFVSPFSASATGDQPESPSRDGRRQTEGGGTPERRQPNVPALSIPPKSRQGGGSDVADGPDTGEDVEAPDTVRRVQTGAGLASLASPLPPKPPLASRSISSAASPSSRRESKDLRAGSPSPSASARTAPVAPPVVTTRGGGVGTADAHRIGPAESHTDNIPPSMRGDSRARRPVSAAAPVPGGSPPTLPRPPPLRKTSSSSSRHSKGGGTEDTSAFSPSPTPRKLREEGGTEGADECPDFLLEEALLSNEQTENRQDLQGGEGQKERRDSLYGSLIVVRRHIELTCVEVKNEQLFDLLPSIEGKSSKQKGGSERDKRLSIPTAGFRRTASSSAEGGKEKDVEGSGPSSVKRAQTQVYSSTGLDHSTHFRLSLGVTPPQGSAQPPPSQTTSVSGSAPLESPRKSSATKAQQLQQPPRGATTPTPAPSGRRSSNPGAAQTGSRASGGTPLKEKPISSSVKGMVPNSRAPSGTGTASVQPRSGSRAFTPAPSRSLSKDSNENPTTTPGPKTERRLSTSVGPRSSIYKDRSPVRTFSFRSQQQQQDPGMPRGGGHVTDRAPQRESERELKPPTQDRTLVPPGGGGTPGDMSLSMSSSSTPQRGVTPTRDKREGGEKDLRERGSPVAEERTELVRFQSELEEKGGEREEGESESGCPSPMKGDGEKREREEEDEDAVSSHSVSAASSVVTSTTRGARRSSASHVVPSIPLRFQMQQRSTETVMIRGKKAQFEKATVGSWEESRHLLTAAVKSREVGRSHINSESSRSHAIFRFSVRTFFSNRTGVAGTLTLVDLAGSEKEHENPTQKGQGEARFINLSLVQLNRTLVRMQTGQMDDSDRRQSALNMLLHEGLREDAGCTMIFCVNPHPEQLQAARATLTMAQNCTAITRKKKLRLLGATGLNEEVDALKKQTEALDRHVREAMEAKQESDARLRETLEQLEKTKQSLADKDRAHSVALEEHQRGLETRLKEQERDRRQREEEIRAMNVLMDEVRASRDELSRVNVNKEDELRRLKEDQEATRALLQRQMSERERELKADAAAERQERERQERQAREREAELLKAAEAEKQRMQKRVEELEALCKALTAEVKLLKRQQETLEEEGRNLRAALKEMEAALLQESDQAEQLAEKLQSTEGERHTLADQLEALQEVMESTQEQCSLMEGACKEAEERAEKAERELTENSAALTASQEALKSAEEENKRLKESNAERAKLMESLQKEKEETEASLREVRDALVLTKGELKSVRGELKEQQEKLDVRSRECEALRTEIGEVRTNLESETSGRLVAEENFRETKEELRCLQAKFEERSRALEAETEDRRKKDDKVEKLSRSVWEAEAKIASLEKDLEKKGAEISDLSREKTKLQGNLDTLQKEKKRTEEKLAGSERQVKSLENVQKRLEEEKESAEQDIADKKEEIENLQSELKETEERLSSTESDLAGTRENKESLESEVEALKVQLEEAHSRTEAEKRAKEETMKQLQAETERAQKGESALQAAEAERGRLMTLIDKERRRVEDAQHVAQSQETAAADREFRLRRERDGVASELSAERQKLAGERERLAASEEKGRELEEELSSLREALEESRGQTEATEENLRVQTERAESSSAALASLSQENESAVRHLERALMASEDWRTRERAGGWKDALERVEAEKRELQNQLNQIIGSAKSPSILTGPHGGHLEIDVGGSRKATLLVSPLASPAPSSVVALPLPLDLSPAASAARRGPPEGTEKEKATEDSPERTGPAVAEDAERRDVMAILQTLYTTALDRDTRSVAVCLRSLVRRLDERLALAPPAVSVERLPPVLWMGEENTKQSEERLNIPGESVGGLQEGVFLLSRLVLASEWAMPFTSLSHLVGKNSTETELDVLARETAAKEAGKYRVWPQVLGSCLRALESLGGDEAVVCEASTLIERLCEALKPSALFGLSSVEMSEQGHARREFFSSAFQALVSQMQAEKAIPVLQEILERYRQRRTVVTSVASALCPLLLPESSAGGGQGGGEADQRCRVVRCGDGVKVVRERERGALAGLCNAFAAVVPSQLQSFSLAAEDRLLKCLVACFRQTVGGRGNLALGFGSLRRIGGRGAGDGKVDLSLNGRLLGESVTKESSNLGRQTFVSVAVSCKLPQTLLRFLRQSFDELEFKRGEAEREAVAAERRAKRGRKAGEASRGMQNHASNQRARLSAESEWATTSFPLVSRATFLLCALLPFQSSTVSREAVGMGREKEMTVGDRVEIVQEEEGEEHRAVQYVVEEGVLSKILSIAKCFASAPSSPPPQQLATPLSAAFAKEKEKEAIEPPTSDGIDVMDRMPISALASLSLIARLLCLMRDRCRRAAERSLKQSSSSNKSQQEQQPQGGLGQSVEDEKERIRRERERSQAEGLRTTREMGAAFREVCSDPALPFLLASVLGDLRGIPPPPAQSVEEKEIAQPDSMAASVIRIPLSKSEADSASPLRTVVHSRASPSRRPARPESGGSFQSREGGVKRCADAAAAVLQREESGKERQDGGDVDGECVQETDSVAGVNPLLPPIWITPLLNLLSPSRPSLASPSSSLCFCRGAPEQMSTGRCRGEMQEGEETEAGEDVREPECPSAPPPDLTRTSLLSDGSACALTSIVFSGGPPDARLSFLRALPPSSSVSPASMTGWRGAKVAGAPGAGEKEKHERFPIVLSLVDALLSRLRRAAAVLASAFALPQMTLCEENVPMVSAALRLCVEASSALCGAFKESSGAGGSVCVLPKETLAAALEGRCGVRTVIQLGVLVAEISTKLRERGGEMERQSHREDRRASQQKWLVSTSGGGPSDFFEGIAAAAQIKNKMGGRAGGGRWRDERIKKRRFIAQGKGNCRGFIEELCEIALASPSLALVLTPSFAVRLHAHQQQQQQQQALRNLPRKSDAGRSRVSEMMGLSGISRLTAEEEGEDTAGFLRDVDLAVSAVGFLLHSMTEFLSSTVAPGSSEDYLASRPFFPEPLTTALFLAASESAGGGGGGPVPGSPGFLSGPGSTSQGAPAGGSTLPFSQTNFRLCTPGGSSLRQRTDEDGEYEGVETLSGHAQAHGGGEMIYGESMGPRRATAVPLASLPGGIGAAPLPSKRLAAVVSTSALPTMPMVMGDREGEASVPSFFSSALPFYAPLQLGALSRGVPPLRSQRQEKERVEERKEGEKGGSRSCGSSQVTLSGAGSQRSRERSTLDLALGLGAEWGEEDVEGVRGVGGGIGGSSLTLPLQESGGRGRDSSRERGGAVRSDVALGESLAAFPVSKSTAAAPLTASASASVSRSPETLPAGAHEHSGGPSQVPPSPSVRLRASVAAGGGMEGGDHGDSDGRSSRTPGRGGSRETGRGRGERHSRGPEGAEWLVSPSPSPGHSNSDFSLSSSLTGGEGASFDSRGNRNRRRKGKSGKERDKRQIGGGGEVAESAATDPNTRTPVRGASNAKSGSPPAGVPALVLRPPPRVSRGQPHGQENSPGTPSSHSPSPLAGRSPASNAGGPPASAVSCEGEDSDEFPTARLIHRQLE